MSGERERWRDDAHSIPLNWKPCFREWPIDETLTPFNAKERGYKWHHDAPYIEVLGEYGAVQNIAEGVTKYGYGLGSPAALTNDEGFGIYEPEGLWERLEQERNRKTRV